MAALHWRPPPPEFFEQNPYLKPTDFKQPVVDVFEECWKPLALYSDNSTQWRVAPNGKPIGLDYNVFFHELDRMNLDNDQYDDFMAMLRVIESQAKHELMSQ